MPGGRCETCEGNGQICIEMHFLPDVWVECDTCRGRRYNPETLAVTYHGQSIADVLDMSCGKAVKLFENIPKIRRILQTLCDVGLDYLTLGQAAPTLSGGEAQRVKLAAELARPDTGRTLYLLDEPTTGLHFDDMAKLLDVLNRLVDLGNTVVVIEHNLDVIKTADWVIDMGPEAGDGGGYVVASGTPEDIVGPCAGRAPAQAGEDGDAAPFAHRRGAGRRRWPPVRTQSASRTTSPPSEAERDGDLDIAEVGSDVAHAVGSRRPPLAHRRSRRPQGQALPLGRPHPGQGRRPHSGSWASSAPPTGTPARVVEIASPTKSRRLVLPRHHRRGVAAEAQVPRGQEHVQARGHWSSSWSCKPLNEMPDLPVYGNEPRVKCKNLRGPWQEVQLQVHSLEEIDKPAFWKFVDAGDRRLRQVHRPRAAESRGRDALEGAGPEVALRPQGLSARQAAQVGRRGAGRAVRAADRDRARRAVPLEQPAGGPPVRPASSSEPWATIHTKRVASVDLVLTGPKGHFALGRITELGAEREFQAGPERDTLRLQFRRRTKTWTAATCARFWPNTWPAVAEETQRRPRRSNFA